MFFGIWKREKRVEKSGREQKIRKMCSLLCLKGARPRPVFQGSCPSRTAGLQRPLIVLILTPLEIFLLPISKNVWLLKIQRSDQKLWLSEVSGASIGASSRFSWYLGHSNSDFDSWKFAGMRIQRSSQCRWLQPVLIFESKLGFLGPLGIDFGSNLVKAVEILREAQVLCKTMKNVVLWEFWPCLTFGLT